MGHGYWTVLGIGFVLNTPIKYYDIGIAIDNHEKYIEELGFEMHYEKQYNANDIFITIKDSPILDARNGDWDYVNKSVLHLTKYYKKQFEKLKKILNISYNPKLILYAYQGS